MPPDIFVVFQNTNPDKWRLPSGCEFRATIFRSVRSYLYGAIMDEQTARAVLSQAEGYIDWDDIRDCPQWYRSKVILEGRFTSDELRAIIEFERKSK